ncbi:MAG: adenylate kinase [Prevotellaceae bacterium]|jgi:adenylate kinase|nr:adenylate kinase [Prevotellaceae bacterium]
MTIIILFGAPGSGKGTQSAFISKKYGFLHLSTGSLLREEAVKNTALGKKIYKFISKGELVPDEMIINILIEEIELHNNASGIILDGFPRTIKQAEELDEILGRRGEKINLMVDIVADEKTLVERLLARGIKSGRSDDNLKIIEKRLDIYSNQTAPIRDYYKKTNRYNKIANNHGTPEECFEKMKKLIDMQI